MVALIHLLPAGFADSCILASAFEGHCWLVEEFSTSRTAHNLATLLLLSEDPPPLLNDKPFRQQPTNQRSRRIVMDDFPEFMKTPKNRVENKDQYSKDIEGYYYNAPDGQQMAFWTAHTAGTSATHTHPFDEYMICIQGQYVVLIGDKEVVLAPGTEYLIPKGTPHACRRTAGTRTIHAFGGKRIQK